MITVTIPVANPMDLKERLNVARSWLRAHAPKGSWSYDIPLQSGEYVINFTFQHQYAQEAMLFKLACL